MIAPAVPMVRAEIIGGDARGRGQEPALCWWLPDGASVQYAYRLRTDDGFDTGRVDSAAQSFVRLPVFDRSRRSAAARVKVWTDQGESEWSDPVALEAGLLSDADWSARWIGVAEGQRPAIGFRPAYWLRTTFATPPASQARLYITALGLYEAFLDGRRVGDVELAPGYTQYRARVQYQPYDVTPLVPPGRHVLAVLLADGWYRGQVGLPRAADQYGQDLALRAQLEVRTGPGWQVVAGSGPGWRVAPSHITAADLIGGQREDHRRLQAGVHDASFDDRAWDGAVARDVGVVIVRSVAPPVRRVQEIRPVAVRPVRDGRAFVVDFGQNFSGWVRLTAPGPAGRRITLSHGEWLDRDGDLTTAHLDVDLPVVPEPLPLGQVDEVVPGSGGEVFEPRFTTTRLPVRAGRGPSRAAGHRRRHGCGRALGPAPARLVQLQRRPGQPAARGGGVVAAVEHLRHPDRLPATRARGLDRRLAGVRADGRVPVRRPGLYPQVAG